MKIHRIATSAAIPVVLALAAFGSAGCSKSQKLLGPDAAVPGPDTNSVRAPVPAEEFARTVQVNPGDIDDHRFVAFSTNRWFPLIPGTTYHYRAETEDGVETQTVQVTHETTRIDGVRVRVVLDVVKLDGKVIERTRDYFAMDEHKNVWYFGEDTESIDPETGEKSTEGSWRSGRDGARAGIIMLGDPDPGEMYNEERATGVAEDQARVLTLQGENSAPFTGDFDNGLKTENTTPLEPGVLEYKYYVPGIGLALEVNPVDNERNKLIRVTHSDRDGDDDDLTGPVANIR